MSRSLIGALGALFLAAPAALGQTLFSESLSASFPPPGGSGLFSGVVVVDDNSDGAGEKRRRRYCDAPLRFVAQLYCPADEIDVDDLPPDDGPSPTGSVAHAGNPRRK